MLVAATKAVLRTHARAHTWFGSCITSMDGMDDGDGLAVVRPTRWKTRESYENADPRATGKISIGSHNHNHDDSDSDDVNMNDTSQEWDTRGGREDDAAFDNLLDMTENAMQSVRLKASPGKRDPEEEEEEDEDEEGSQEYDEDDHEHDGSEAYDEHSVEDDTYASGSHESESSSFDFDVDKSNDGMPGSPKNEWASPGKKMVVAKQKKTNHHSRGENVGGRVSSSTVRRSQIDPSTVAVKEWIQEQTSLNTKQRLIEQTLANVGVSQQTKDLNERDVRKSHDFDFEKDFVSARVDRDSLKTDLHDRLSTVRGGVKKLAKHVRDVRGGESYVLELGRLMDTAERDVVALKEAQRSAYDRLVKEERDLTRHVDDFNSRLETWDNDRSDPVYAGLADSGNVKKTSKGRRAYGVTPVKKSAPWSRGKVAKVQRPSSGNPADSERQTATQRRNKSLPAAERGPGPWARAAGTTRSPGSNDSPGSAGGKPTSAQKAAARREPPPPAVVEYDEFLEEYGVTGGWTDVDHARWRRCLARCNMHYGAATAMAAEDLVAFGIDRAEVVRHARWDAEREHLFDKKKEAVRAWRAAQTAAARETRDALDAQIARVEEEQRVKASAKAAAAREKEQASLREWKAKKRLADEQTREANLEAQRLAKETELERKKALKRERAERDKRNALRALEREELRETSRLAAEAAAEALIPSAPKMTKEEAKLERDRLAARAMEAALKKREAASAKASALTSRVERQKALAVKARERQRASEGKTHNSLDDPDRLTRATAASALRAASERDAHGLFAAAPAVQYLSHKATPTWRAMR